METYGTRLGREAIEKIVQISEEITNYINAEITPNIYQNITVVFGGVYRFYISCNMWHNNKYEISYGYNDAPGGCLYEFPVPPNHCHLEIMLALIQNWPFIKQELVKQVKFQQEQLKVLDNFQL